MRCKPVAQNRILNGLVDIPPNTTYHPPHNVLAFMYKILFKCIKDTLQILNLKNICYP